MEVCGQLHPTAALLPRKVPDTHWKEVWVGPRAGWTWWRT